MKFLDKDHRALIERLESLWKAIDGLTELGQSFGIEDIFQDNGAKILQQCIYMNMLKLKDREGNDAKDEFGIEWELKSANEMLVSGFSTHHHLNPDVLAKYRTVPWMFSFYNHSHLTEIYVMSAETLEPMFQNWEDDLCGKKIRKSGIKGKRDHLNNPKIPFKFVRQFGINVYPFPKLPVNPAEAVRIIKKRK